MTPENMRVTMLYRPNGTWTKEELDKLAMNLKTAPLQNPLEPEYVILFEHYSKSIALAAIGGGVAFTATELIGINNPRLPFSIVTS